jgi:hypothetical protein
MKNITYLDEFDNAGQPIQLSTNDFSDVAEAVMAVLRAAGLPVGHTRTILAALAEVNGNSQEVAVYFSRLGARLKTNLDAYCEGEDLDKLNKTNSQRWRRALEKLETDQDEAGFYFVVCKRGGSDRNSSRHASRMKVNVEVFTQTVNTARRRADFAKSRKFAFEEAAKEVLTTFNLKPVRRIPIPRMTSDDLQHRKQKTFTNAFRWIGKEARKQNLTAKDLEDLEKLIIDKAVRAFYEGFHEADMCDVEGNQTAEIDTVSKIGVSHSTKEESVPPLAVESDFSGGHTLSDLSEEASVDAALTAVDVFASVGVKKLNVFFTEPERDSLVGKIEANLTLGEVARRMPEFVERNRNEPLSLVFDMKTNGAWLLQIDEASKEVLELLAPVSFAQIETSDANGQSWVALPTDTDEQTCREIKERLFRKLKPLGANCGASGGLRWVGTFNRKASRVREDGTSPVVKMVAYNYALTVTPEELEALGLLAPRLQPMKPKATGLHSSNRAVPPSRFPDYQKSLSDVRPKDNGTPDRSAADILYAATCLSWGFSKLETVDSILENSTKAREQHSARKYAEDKVDYADRVRNRSRYISQ